MKQMFFLEFSCFFYDSMDVGNLVSASSAFSKFNLNIWKFLVYAPLKPSLEIFEHYFANIWDDYNCVVVWIVTLFTSPLYKHWVEENRGCLTSTNWVTSLFSVSSSMYAIWWCHLHEPIQVPPPQTSLSHIFQLFSYEGLAH